MSVLQFVDSHCHLDYDEFQAEFDAIIERAQNVGVTHMTTIGTSLKNFPNTLKIAEKVPFIYATIGIHPHDAEKEKDATYEDLANGAKHPKVIGIGETGLDYFYEHSPKELQQQLFRLHIKVARDFDLPLIVHTRDADDDCLRILQEEMAIGTFKGLIHCFTASKEFADEVLKLGFYISISGIATFKKALELREIVKNLPLERLLIETDSPYLAPIPHRGKRNEPSFVVHVAEAIAELKDCALSKVAEQTTKNYFDLFQKIPR
ncbi:MAG: TatD family hydrolase [Alphaproteobacteria bacterium]|nr:TatD family hydrolase [Alphaproteobacteria bacterium]